MSSQKAESQECGAGAHVRVNWILPSLIVIRRVEYHRLKFHVRPILECDREQTRPVFYHQDKICVKYNLLLRVPTLYLHVRTMK